MRKRTKRKVYNVIPDTMSYVKSGMMAIADVPQAGVKLQLVNYSSFDEIVRGTPDKRHVDDLINMVNIAELLADKFEIGKEYLDLIYKCQDAIFSMAQRGISGKTFRFTGEELNVARDTMELHSEQLKLTTVKQMEQALKDVRDVYIHRKARVIKPLETA